MHIGWEKRSFKRERTRAMRNLVSEIYFPPCVTKMLSRMKGHPLAPRFALEITCHDPDDGEPWDFDIREKREKALRMVRETKPLFIGSPMCMAWCAWQGLNSLKRDPTTVRREIVKARLHLSSVIMLYREQIAEGR